MMDKKKSTANNIRLGLAAMLMVLSLPVMGTEGCWAEFFDEAQYAGQHVRVDGPLQLENLNDVQGSNWDKRIHSLKVGPKAKITVFQNPKLVLPDKSASPELLQSLGLNDRDIKEDAELVFNPNAAIHDLGDFNFHKKIRSLKIECL